MRHQIPMLFSLRYTSSAVNIIKNIKDAMDDETILRFELILCGQSLHPLVCSFGDEY